MHQSPLHQFCTWIAYACTAPFLIIAWFVLLTFNPYDSYWLYDVSHNGYSLMHPINFIGFFVYLFGVSAWIIMIALTHVLFRYASPEEKILSFVDYSAGYLFLLIAFSGLAVVYAYDPYNAAAPGGLFGQQLHSLFSIITTSSIEQITLHLMSLCGTCFIIGFSWAHYVLLLIKPLLFPYYLLHHMGTRCVKLFGPVTTWLYKHHETSHPIDELELDVYTITRTQSDTQKHDIM